MWAGHSPESCGPGLGVHRACDGEGFASPCTVGGVHGLSASWGIWGFSKATQITHKDELTK